MDLSTFLVALKARLKFILVFALGFLGIVIAVSLLLPKTYKATTTIFLNHKSFDPVTGTPTPTQLITGFVDTQRDVINSKATAIRVAEELRLDQRQQVLDELDIEMTPDRTLLMDRIAGRLLKQLDVQSARDSSVLNISFKWPQPDTAAELANGFAAAYLATNLRLKRAPLHKASGSFNEHLKVLRKDLENAQNRLASYRKENRLMTNVADADVEIARLNELSTELVDIENQLVDASSKQRGAKSNSESSPTVAEDELIRDIRRELAQAESAFAGLKADLLPAHPKYISQEAEVKRLRRDLNAYVESNIKTVGNQVGILRERRAEVGKALDEQRARVLDLNMARDHLTLLAEDVDNAKRAFEEASSRYSQIHIESLANQPDVSIMNAAIAPELPASPRLAFNALLGSIAGLLLGIGLALLYEVRNPRVLGISEIVHEIGIPVLGQLNWNRKNADKGKRTFDTLALPR